MTSSEKAKKLLRKLPAVHALLRKPVMQELVQQAGHNLASLGLRHALQECRRQIQEGERTEIEEKDLLAVTLDWVKEQTDPSLRSVINATGVIATHESWKGAS